MVSHGSQSTRHVVAILTDFGADSFYTGAMKAAILAVHPEATLVDITHSVSPQAIKEGSFLLARVLDVFAEGTVLLAVVDPGVGGSRSNLIARFDGRTVVAPDNGLISDAMIEHRCDGCYVIREADAVRVRCHTAVGSTFMGRDVLGPIAAALAKGEAVDDVADRIDEPVTVALPVVEHAGNVLTGRVRYIDSFGNMLTNISRAHVERAFGDCPLHRIRARVGGSEIHGIRDFFAQTPPGSLTAILNSWNIVEIAVGGGRASERLGGSTATTVALDAM